MWAKRQAAEARRAEREQLAQERDEKKELAAEKTREAEEATRQIENVLAYTLDIDDAIDWEQLKDHAAFEEVHGSFDKPKPEEPRKEKPPSAPERSDYVVNFDFLDSLIQSRRAKKVADPESEL